MRNGDGEERFSPTPVASGREGGRGKDPRRHAGTVYMVSCRR
jgi:hypothetical protein